LARSVYGGGGLVSVGGGFGGGARSAANGKWVFRRKDGTPY
jgi:hypothetical protein